ncbi:MaoC family dehydratase N-terminal domain-containing protein [Sphingopyxis sp. GW247-27LB]|uniref:MaoC family dehydratase n=1 Tax=Sphingopyxis sp. GW247-27LB TaxID=2012632 RepID=UPI000BA67BD9|nr:MaoC family dehydratase N-terminal domain-containing protein [Sphingopyxis sp. GW247-27LB]PAL21513.1 acyl dehydratase [Sphingopyxis sp. GW247-27LB]
MNDDHVRRLGQGFYWQDLSEGDRFVTFRRTITETDLVNFISVTGMLEELFIDASHAGGAMGGRVVPAALTYSLIEGMLLQTMIQGTGMALLETHSKALKPVRVGDTIYARVEVTKLKPTSKGNRAIVESAVDIRNQDGDSVMTYVVTRMLAGSPAET